MKKLGLLLISIITIVSCSSDDSTTQNVNDPILGRWGAYKSVNNSNSNIEYFVPYDGVATYNPDGTFIQSFFDSQTEGTWENLGNNSYRFNLFGIQTEGEIQFIGDDEFTTNEFGETDHFRHIDTDEELRNKIVGTWQLLESCGNDVLEESIAIFNASGTGSIGQDVDDLTWEINNGSLYISLVDFPDSEPTISNIIFDSNDRMRIEFDSNGFTIQCLVRVE